MEGYEKFGLGAAFSFDADEKSISSMSTIEKQLLGIVSAVQRVEKTVDRSNFSKGFGKATSGFRQSANQVAESVEKVTQEVDSLNRWTKNANKSLSPLRAEFKALKAEVRNVDFGDLYDDDTFQRAEHDVHLYIDALKQLERQFGRDTAAEREFAAGLKTQQAVAADRLELSRAQRKASIASQRVGVSSAIQTTGMGVIGALSNPMEKAEEYGQQLGAIEKLADFGDLDTSKGMASIDAMIVNLSNATGVIRADVAGVVQDLASAGQSFDDLGFIRDEVEQILQGAKALDTTADSASTLDIALNSAYKKSLARYGGLIKFNEAMQSSINELTDKLPDVKIEAEGVEPVLAALIRTLGDAQNFKAYDITAFAAVGNALGKEPELMAAFVNRLSSDIAGNAEAFATAVNMGMGDFEKLLNTDKLSVIQKIATAYKSLQGDELKQGAFFKNLGIVSAQDKAILQGLSTYTETLGNARAVSARGFDESMLKLVKQGKMQRKEYEAMVNEQYKLKIISKETFDELISGYTKTGEELGKTTSVQREVTRLQATTAFQSQRFKSAVDNLATSFGKLIDEALLPVKTVSANLIEGVTWFIQHFPLLSRAIALSVFLFGALAAVAGTAGVVMFGFSAAAANAEAALITMRRGLIPLTGFFETSMQSFGNTNPIADAFTMIRMQSARLLPFLEAVTIAINGLAASSFAFLASPLGMAVAALVGLYAILELATPQINVLATVISTLAAPLGFVVGLLKGFAEGILMAVSPVGSALGNTLATPFHMLGEAIQQVQAIYEDFVKRGETLGKIFGLLIANTILIPFRSAASAILTLWRGLIVALQIIFKPLIAFVSWVHKFLVSNLAENSPGPTYVIRQKWQMTVDFIKSLFSDLVKWAGRTGKRIADAVSAAWSSIASPVQSAFGDAISNLQTLFSKFIEMVVSAPKAIVSAFGGIGSAIQQSFQFLAPGNPIAKFLKSAEKKPAVPSPKDVAIATTVAASAATEMAPVQKPKQKDNPLDSDPSWDFSKVKTDAQIAEVLAKKIAYVDFNELLNPDTQNAKAIKSQAFLKEHGLIIDQIIQDTESGLDALGLKSVLGDTSKLIFRGTQEFADVVEDLTGTIGENQFGKGVDSIRSVLEMLQRESGKKVDVYGHSLGGALAQIATANFPEMVNREADFNSPGVTRREVEKLKAAQAAGVSAPEIHHYIKKGDIVSAGGEAFLPGQTSLFSDTKSNFFDPTQVLKHHKAMMLNETSNFQQTEVDTDALNKGAYRAGIISRDLEEMIRSGVNQSFALVEASSTSAAQPIAAILGLIQSVIDGFNRAAEALATIPQLFTNIANTINQIVGSFQASYEFVKNQLTLIDQAFLSKTVAQADKLKARQALFVEFVNTLTTVLKTLASVYQFVFNLTKDVVKNLDLLSFGMLTVSYMAFKLVTMVEAASKLGQLIGGIGRFVGVTLPIMTAVAISSGLVKALEDNLFQALKDGITFAYEAFGTEPPAALLKFVDDVQATADYVSEKLRPIFAGLVSVFLPLTILARNPLTSVPFIVSAFKEFVKSPSVRSFVTLTGTVLSGVLKLMMAIGKIILYIASGPFALIFAIAAENASRLAKTFGLFETQVPKVISQVSGFGDRINEIKGSVTQLIRAVPGALEIALTKFSSFLRTLPYGEQLATGFEIAVDLVKALAQILRDGFSFAMAAGKRFVAIMAKTFPIDDLKAIAPAFGQVFGTIAKAMATGLGSMGAIVQKALPFLINPIAFLRLYRKMGGFLEHGIKALNPIDLLMSNFDTEFKVIMNKKLKSALGLMPQSQVVLTLFDKIRFFAPPIIQILLRLFLSLSTLYAILKPLDRRMLSFFDQMEINGVKLGFVADGIMMLRTVVVAMGDAFLSIIDILRDFSSINMPDSFDAATGLLFIFSHLGKRAVPSLIQTANGIDAVAYKLKLLGQELDVPNWAVKTLKVVNFAIGTIKLFMTVLGVTARVIKGIVFGIVLAIPMALVVIADSALITAQLTLKALRTATKWVGDELIKMAAYLSYVYRNAAEGNFQPLGELLLRVFTISPIRDAVWNYVLLPLYGTIVNFLQASANIIAGLVVAILKVGMGTIAYSIKYAMELAQGAFWAITHPIEALQLAWNKLVRAVEIGVIAFFSLRTVTRLLPLIIGSIVAAAGGATPVLEGTAAAVAAVAVGISPIGWAAVAAIALVGALAVEYQRNFKEIDAVIQQLSHPIEFLNNSLEKMIALVTDPLRPLKPVGEFFKRFGKQILGFLALAFVVFAAFEIKTKGIVGGLVSIAKAIGGILFGILKLIPAMLSFGKASYKTGKRVKDSFEFQTYSAEAVHRARSGKVLGVNPLGYKNQGVQEATTASLDERKALIRYRKEVNKVRKQQLKSMEALIIKRGTGKDEEYPERYRQQFSKFVNTEEKRVLGVFKKTRTELSKLGKEHARIAVEREIREGGGRFSDKFMRETAHKSGFKTFMGEELNDEEYRDYALAGKQSMKGYDELLSKSLDEMISSEMQINKADVTMETAIIKGLEKILTHSQLNPGQPIVTPPPKGTDSALSPLKQILNPEDIKQYKLTQETLALLGNNYSELIEQMEDGTRQLNQKVAKTLGMTTAKSKSINEISLEGLVELGRAMQLPTADYYTDKEYKKAGLDRQLAKDKGVDKAQKQLLALQILGEADIIRPQGAHVGDYKSATELAVDIVRSAKGQEIKDRQTGKTEYIPGVDSHSFESIFKDPVFAKMDFKQIEEYKKRLNESAADAHKFNAVRADIIKELIEFQIQQIVGKGLDIHELYTPAQTGGDDPWHGAADAADKFATTVSAQAHAAQQTADSSTATVEATAQVVNAAEEAQKNATVVQKRMGFFGRIGAAIAGIGKAAKEGAAGFVKDVKDIDTVKSFVEDRQKAEEKRLRELRKARIQEIKKKSGAKSDMAFMFKARLVQDSAGTLLNTLLNNEEASKQKTANNPTLLKARDLFGKQSQPKILELLKTDQYKDVRIALEKLAESKNKTLEQFVKDFSFEYGSGVDTFIHNLLEQEGMKGSKGGGPQNREIKRIRTSVMKLFEGIETGKTDTRGKKIFKYRTPAQIIEALGGREYDQARRILSEYAKRRGQSLEQFIEELSGRQGKKSWEFLNQMLVESGSIKDPFASARKEIQQIYGRLAPSIERFKKEGLMSPETRKQLAAFVGKTYGKFGPDFDKYLENLRQQGKEYIFEELRLAGAVPELAPGEKIQGFFKKHGVKDFEDQSSLIETAYAQQLLQILNKGEFDPAKINVAVMKVMGLKGKKLDPGEMMTSSSAMKAIQRIAAAANMPIDMLLDPTLTLKDLREARKIREQKLLQVAKEQGIGGLKDLRARIGANAQEFEALLEGMNHSVSEAVQKDLATLLNKSSFEEVQQEISAITLLKQARSPKAIAKQMLKSVAMAPLNALGIPGYTRQVNYQKDVDTRLGQIGAERRNRELQEEQTRRGGEAKRRLGLKVALMQAGTSVGKFNAALAEKNLTAMFDEFLRTGQFLRKIEGEEREHFFNEILKIKPEKLKDLRETLAKADKQMSLYFYEYMKTGQITQGSAIKVGGKEISQLTQLKSFMQKNMGITPKQLEEMQKNITDSNMMGVLQEYMKTGELIRNLTSEEEEFLAKTLGFGDDVEKLKSLDSMLPRNMFEKLQLRFTDYFASITEGFESFTTNLRGTLESNFFLRPLLPAFEYAMNQIDKVRKFTKTRSDQLNAGLAAGRQAIANAPVIRQVLAARQEYRAKRGNSLQGMMENAGFKNLKGFEDIFVGKLEAMGLESKELQDEVLKAFLKPGKGGVKAALGKLEKEFKGISDLAFKSFAESLDLQMTKDQFFKSEYTADSIGPFAAFLGKRMPKILEEGVGHLLIATLKTARAAVGFGLRSISPKITRTVGAFSREMFQRVGDLVNGFGTWVFPDQSKGVGKMLFKLEGAIRRTGKRVQGYFEDQAQIVEQASHHVGIQRITSFVGKAMDRIGNAYLDLTASMSAILTTQLNRAKTIAGGKLKDNWLSRAVKNVGSFFRNTVERINRQIAINMGKVQPPQKSQKLEMPPKSKTEQRMHQGVSAARRREDIERMRGRQQFAQRGKQMPLYGAAPPKVLANLGKALQFISKIATPKAEYKESDFITRTVSKKSIDAQGKAIPGARDHFEVKLQPIQTRVMDQFRKMAHEAGTAIGKYFAGAAKRTEHAWARAKREIVGKGWKVMMKRAVYVGKYIVQNLNHGAADKTAAAWQRTESVFQMVTGEMAKLSEVHGHEIAADFQHAAEQAIHSFEGMTKIQQIQKRLIEGAISPEQAKHALQLVSKEVEHTTHQLEHAGTTATRTSGAFGRLGKAFGRIGRAGMAVGGGITAAGFAAQTITFSLQNLGVISEETGADLYKFLELFTIMGAIGGIVAPAIQAVVAVVGAAGAVFAAVGGAIGGVLSILTTVGGAIVTFFLTPWGLAVAAVIGAVLLINWGLKKYLGIDILGSIFDAISGKVGEVAGWISAHFGSIFTSIETQVLSMLGRIWTLMEPITKPIMEAGNHLIDAFNLRPIVNNAVQTFADFKVAIQTAITETVTWLQNAWSGFTDKFSEILNPITNTAATVADKLIGLLNHSPTVKIPIAWEGATEKIKESLGGVSTFGAWVGDQWNKLMTPDDKVVDQTKQVATAQADAIKDAQDSVAQLPAPVQAAATTPSIGDQIDYLRRGGSVPEVLGQGLSLLGQNLSGFGLGMVDRLRFGGGKPEAAPVAESVPIVAANTIPQTLSAPAAPTVVYGDPSQPNFLQQAGNWLNGLNPFAKEETKKPVHPLDPKKSKPVRSFFKFLNRQNKQISTSGSEFSDSVVDAANASAQLEEKKGGWIDSLKALGTGAVNMVRGWIAPKAPEPSEMVDVSAAVEQALNRAKRPKWFGGASKDTIGQLEAILAGGGKVSVDQLKSLRSDDNTSELSKYFKQGEIADANAKKFAAQREAVKKQVVQGLSDVSMEFQSRVDYLVRSGYTDIGALFTPGLEEMSSGLTGLYYDVLTFAVDGGKALMKLDFKGLAQAAKDFGTNFGAAATSVLGGLFSMTLSMVAFSVSWIISLGPVGIALVGITLAVLAITFNVLGLRRIVVGTFKVIAGVLEIIWSLVEGVAGVVHGIFMVLAGIPKAILGDFSGMADGIIKILQSLDKAGASIFHGLETAFAGIKDILQGILMDALQLDKIFKGLFDGITLAAEKTYEGLQALGSFLASLPERTSRMVDDFTSNLYAAIQTLPARIAQTNREIEEAGGLFPFLGQKVTDAVTQARDSVTSAVDSMIQGYKRLVGYNEETAQSFSQAWGRIEEAFQATWMARVVEAVQFEILKLKAAIDNLLESLKNTLIGFKSALESLFEPILSIFGGLRERIAGIGNINLPILTGDFSAFEEFGQRFDQLIGNIRSKLAGKFELPIFSGDFSGFDNFVAQVDQFITNLRSKLSGDFKLPLLTGNFSFEGALEQVDGFITAIKQKLTGDFKLPLLTGNFSVLEGFRDQVGSVIDSMLGKWQEFAQNINSIPLLQEFIGFIQSLPQIIEDVAQQIEQVITGIGDRLTASVKSATEGISQTIQSVTGEYQNLQKEIENKGVVQATAEKAQKDIKATGRAFGRLFGAKPQEQKEEVNPGVQAAQQVDNAWQKAGRSVQNTVEAMTAATAVAGQQQIANLNHSPTVQIPLAWAGMVETISGHLDQMTAYTQEAGVDAIDNLNHSPTIRIPLAWDKMVQNVRGRLDEFTAQAEVSGNQLVTDLIGNPQEAIVQGWQATVETLKDGMDAVSDKSKQVADEVGYHFEALKNRVVIPTPTIDDAYALVDFDRQMQASPAAQPGPNQQAVATVSDAPKDTSQADPQQKVDRFKSMVNQISKESEVATTSVSALGKTTQLLGDIVSTVAPAFAGPVTALSGFVAGIIGVAGDVGEFVGSLPELKNALTALMVRLGIMKQVQVAANAQVAASEAAVGATALAAGTAQAAGAATGSTVAVTGAGLVGTANTILAGTFAAVGTAAAAAWTLVTGPLLPIIIGIGLVIAAVVALWLAIKKNFLGLGTLVQGVVGGFKLFFNLLWNGFVGVFVIIYKTFQNTFGQIWKQIVILGQLFVKPFEPLMKLFGVSPTGGGSGESFLVKGIKGVVNAILLPFRAIGFLINLVIKSIGFIISAIVVVGQVLVDIFMEPIRAIVSVVMDIFKVFQDLGKAIVDAFSPLIGAVNDTNKFLGNTETFNYLGAVKKALEIAFFPLRVAFWMLGMIIKTLGFLLVTVLKIGVFIVKAFLSPFKLLFSLGRALNKVFMGIASGLLKVGQVLVETVLPPFRWIWDLVQSIFNAVISFPQKIASFFLSIPQMIGDAIANIPIIENLLKAGGDFFNRLFGGSGQSPGTNSQSPGFAGGGPIHGAGSGTSDAINLWASRGEYIVNAESTRRHFGLIQSINEDPDRVSVQPFPPPPIVLPPERNEVEIDGDGTAALPPMNFNFTFGDIIIQGAADGIQAASEFLDQIEPQLQRRIRDLLRDMVEKAK